MIKFSVYWIVFGIIWIVFGIIWIAATYFFGCIFAIIKCEENRWNFGQFWGEILNLYFGPFIDLEDRFGHLFGVVLIMPYFGLWPWSILRFIIAYKQIEKDYRLKEQRS